MEPTATIFTIYLKPDNEDNRDHDRITRVLANNSEVRCVKVGMDFEANKQGILTLQIPMRYVNIVFVNGDD